MVFLIERKKLRIRVVLRGLDLVFSRRLDTDPDPVLSLRQDPFPGQLHPDPKPMVMAALNKFVNIKGQTMRSIKYVFPATLVMIVSNKFVKKKNEQINEICIYSLSYNTNKKLYHLRLFLEFKIPSKKILFVYPILTQIIVFY